MAKTRRIRVVFDTNWYVSACINRNSRRKLYGFLTDERLIVLYDRHLTAEFSSVISRSKFQKYIETHQVQRFMGLVLSRLSFVDSKSVVTASRDPKDNYLLALSRDGKADFLVTGDPDLLVLGQFEKTRILKMADFEESLAV